MKVKKLTELKAHDIINKALASTSKENPTISEGLRSFPVSSTAINTLEWRYRAIGYFEAMYAGRAISKSLFRQLVIDLIGESEKDGDRPGREHSYNIDITTSHNGFFNFDVSATNCLDAYFQLSKRASYRNITDIILVRVFNGKAIERTGESKPVRELAANELVFIV